MNPLKALLWIGVLLLAGANAHSQSTQVVTVDAHFDARPVLTVPNPTATGQFFVDKAGPIIININSDSRFVICTVTGPNNSSYTTASGTGYSYSVFPDPSDPTSTGVNHTIEVPSAAVGVYSYVISSSVAITAPARVALRVDFPTSPVRAGLFGAATLQREGRDVWLSVLLFEGSAGRAGANVVAELRRIDVPSPPIPMTFVDDGSPGDAAAGDGIYAGRAPAQPTGEFAIFAVVTGVASNGNPFARSLFQAFPIQPLLATVGPNWSETATDVDGDGLFDGIELTTEAEVFVPGTYNSVVVLRASNGNALAATVQFNAASIGTFNPTVRFESIDIVEDLNSNGPFSVESASLEFVTPQGVKSVCDTRNDLGSTGAYQLLQFERPPILVLPGTTGQYIDANGNGLIDTVQITVPVALQFAGSYQWSAILVGSNGQQIAVGSGSGSRPAGVTSVALGFSGSTIHASGFDGPYRVKTFLMFGQGKSTTVDQIFTTAALSHCVFEGGSGVSVTFYRDADGDGYGNANAPIAVCGGTPPTGYVTNSADCDDTRTLYLDSDGDGVGSGTPAACGVPTSGDDCPNDPNKVQPGFCGCGVADIDADGNGTLDCADVTLTMTPSTAPVVAGGTFTVRVSASASYYQLTGFQLAIHFDVDKLDLTAVTAVAGSPYEVVLASQTNNLLGTLRYAAGIMQGAPGVTAATDLVDLVFSVKPDADLCGISELVRFENVGNFSSRLSRVGGFQNPVTVSLPPRSLDTIPPTISGVPSSGSLPADAGSTYGAFVAAPTVTALDTCDGVITPALQITLPGGATSSSWPSGGMFPVGASTLVWTATDAAGNSVSRSAVIVVHPYQLLNVNVCFVGALSAPATRQVRITAGGGVSVKTFSLVGSCGLADSVQVPVAATYPCITVKDPTHSLAMTASTTIVDRHYEASVTLEQGDSNDDDMVDIVDFGLFLDDFGSGKPRDARSNFNADTFVNNFDFAFVSLSFFKVGTSCSPPLDGPSPRSRVSLQQLRREGLGHLESADLNRDGWLDMRDVQLFTQGGFNPGLDVPQGN